MTTTGFRSNRVEADDALAAIDLYFERGWTDGLPIVPPTEERVRAMLAAVARDPAEIVGRLPSRRREVSLEKLAVNAVMAGCLPAYFPVIVTAIEAMSEPQYDMHGTTASTAGAAPLVIVHGPIAERLGVRHGTNLFGQGNRANATIGRAVMLILMNCFGAQPGVLDRAIVGHPGKYSYCIAENETVSPWEPLHVSRGMPAGCSAVTVFAGEGPHQVYNESASTPEGILSTYAAAIADAANLGGPGGGEYIAVIVPQHAEYLRRAGWSRGQVQAFLYERATVSRAAFERAGKVWRWEQDELSVPASADSILVIVAGGDGGGKASVVPPWVGRTRSVTRQILGRGV